MTVYFSWRKTDEESIQDWKAGRFTYTHRGEPSRKAFWLYKATSEYRPKRNISDDRILIAYDIADTGEAWIENPRFWILYPRPPFEGETKHPNNVIVKDNEKGAFGIGANILPKLIAKKIRLATRDEIASSLKIAADRVDYRRQNW